jgi:phage terminase large subunit
LLDRTRYNWPPDYDAEVRRRHALLVRLHRGGPKFVRGAIDYYANSGAEGVVSFINDWCETFDPRNAATGLPTRMPFLLFPKQVELVEFLYACYSQEADGLIEKSRDMGASWVCVSFSVWAFLFQEGASVGWGSRKAAQVDKIGDMSSIFEKLRSQMLSIPTMFWPKGFDASANMSQMKIYEPRGNSVVGEAGDDVGRGGRTKIYFKDESAHYEHPEMIEAALGDNTRVQMDISSVNGLGNVFHRKRESGVEWTPGQPVARGKTNVFVMDWSEHPGKTQAWYDEREAKAIDDGLLHIFRQEVDRDYAASVEGVIIPAEWVKTAIDAHVKLGIETGRGWYAGLDVADEGGDRNALAVRRGILINGIDEWGLPDVGQTTRRAVDDLTKLIEPNAKGRRPVRVMYDSIGVGAGVKAEVNRLTSDEIPEDQRMPAGLKFYSWNAGAKVVNEDDKVVESDDGEAPTNKEFFQNLKAQAWWSLRRRFELTHRAVTEGIKIDPELLISIPSTLPKLRSLQKELSQPTSKKSATMKTMVNKKPDGSKSPNLADALVMCFFPVETSSYDTSLDWV